MEKRQKRLSVDLKIKFWNPKTKTKETFNELHDSIVEICPNPSVNDYLEQDSDEDLWNEATLFAADRYQINEEEGDDFSFDTEHPVPKIANIRATVVADDLTVFIEHNSGRRS